MTLAGGNPAPAPSASGEGNDPSKTAPATAGGTGGQGAPTSATPSAPAAPAGQSPRSEGTVPSGSPTGATELTQQVSRLTAEVGTGREALKASELQLAELRAQLSASGVRVTQLETQLLELRRQGIAKAHSLDPTTLKDTTGAQLDALERVLPAARPPTPGARGFDASGAGAGDLSGLTGKQKIAAGLAQEAKR